jgi:NAD(P)-dependent dehydrogenase (short-subunit alcohol dehydrogenase family)
MADAKTALVSGAARGIGAAIAARLADSGWRVVLADRDPGGVRVARRIGSRARFQEADVSVEEDVLRAINEVNEREGRLDALVCNAGLMIRKPLAQQTLDEWNRVLATNLTSTFLLARAAEELLRDARGAIVTIASTRAHQSERDAESYSASKGGLVALTHALAVSLGPRVRVNCISPGWINSRGEKLRDADNMQHPAGRVGTPDDISSLVAWLLGPHAGFITGAEFIIDGGMTRKMIYV